MLVFDVCSSHCYYSTMARQTESIQLSKEERRSLKTLFSGGNDSNRKQTRARILDLLARKRTATEIASLLGCSPTTVYNIKHRYRAEGLESALAEKPRSGKPRRISGEACARITALACSDAPAGHARWTLRLLADKAVELDLCDSVSHNHIRAILKKTNSDRI